jgi:hypothetical protein
MIFSDDQLETIKNALLKRVIRASIHELNQPITAIDFTASTLGILAKKDSHTFSAEAEELSEGLYEAQARLSSVFTIFDWLTREQTDPRKIPVQDVLSDCLKLLTVRFRHAQIRVETIFPKNPIQLTTRPDAFCYALLSILFTIYDETVRARAEHHLSIETPCPMRVTLTENASLISISFELPGAVAFDFQEALPEEQPPTTVLVSSFAAYLSRTSGGSLTGSNQAEDERQGGNRQAIIRLSLPKL